MKLSPKIALTVAFTVLSITPSLAATFTVTNTGDNGAGSLREAIDLANNMVGDDVINFLLGDSQQTINLDSELSIIDNLSINGLGADLLTIRGNQQNFYIFNIASNVIFEVSGLTITNGFSGIFNLGGSTTVTNSTIKGNSIGGIENFGGGTATVTNSTISDNFYGFLNFGGSTATITNSTIDNNGTGILGNFGSTTTVTNNTISNNDTGINNSNLSIAIVTDSTIFGNNSGISNDGGSTATVTNSTINFNEIGIFNNKGILNTENITFANNGVNIVNVPEPSAVLGFAGLGLLGLLRKKTC